LSLNENRLFIKKWGRVDLKYDITIVDETKLQGDQLCLKMIL
jgi:hypothetical protein